MVRSIYLLVSWRVSVSKLIGIEPKDQDWMKGKGTEVVKVLTSAAISAGSEHILLKHWKWFEIISFRNFDMHSDVTLLAG